MNCSRCDRPATIKGFCKGHYNSRRTKWVRAGKWQPLISVIGVTRRLRALVALGHTQNELCRRSGISPSTLSHLIRGSVDRTSADTARKVHQLYEQLSMTPGESDYYRNRARKSGWAPPLAWDDDTIDDPEAKPDLGQRRGVPFDEKYWELKELGYSDLEILSKLKVQPESLLRQMHRYNIAPSPELATTAHRSQYTNSGTRKR